MITETKLDSNFSRGQFIISGYSKPYRLGRNRIGRGVFIYIREGIPSKELRFFDMLENVESILVEINFLKTKWLVCGCYHPPS